MCAINKTSLPTGLGPLGVAVALGLTLALGGCGEAASPGGPQTNAPTAANALSAPPVSDGVELADRVFWLDPSQALGVEISADTIAFEAPIPPDVAELGVDDVIVSDVGAGFWRAVDRIERSHDRLVLHTRTAGLDEVVENGAFSFTFRSADAAETRGSELRPYDRIPVYIPLPAIDTEEVLGSLDLSTDLGASSRADASNANLQIDATNGGLDFQPAIRLYFVVANGQIFRERFRVSGWADLDADWTVTAQGPSSLTKARRLLAAGGVDDTLEFRLVGRQFSVTPNLRLAYQVTATGQGSADFGVDGEGYVLAGYDCKFGISCAAIEPETGTTPFAAVEQHQLGSGTPNISFKVALLSGVSLQEQGVTTASVTPLSMVFDAHANVSPPFCPYEAVGTASGKSENDQGRYGSYRYDLFDVTQLFSGQNGCGVTTPPDDNGGGSQSPCISDADCPSGQMCMFGANKCIEESPLAITLKWSQSVDLDLRVETSSGEILSATTPNISNGELLAMSAGGTDCDGCIGECAGGVAVDCASETPDNGSCPSMCEYETTTTGTCSGNRFVLCEGLDDTECLSANTCVLKPFLAGNECLGIYVDSCDGLDQNTCESSFNCSWSSSTTEWCEGGQVACSDLDENTCNNQGACSWELGSGGGGEVPPFVEHAAITRADAGDNFRIWVVNESGTEDESANYELLFRTDTGETFEMRGEFEPQASSQSVFYDYEYQ